MQGVGIYPMERYCLCSQKKWCLPYSQANLRSGNINILTDTSLDESPTVSPNGNVIIYATKDGDKDILAGITLDGKTKFIMPSLKGEAREPSWSPLID